MQTEHWLLIVVIEIFVSQYISYLWYHVGKNQGKLIEKIRCGGFGLLVWPSYWLDLLLSPTDRPDRTGLSANTQFASVVSSALIFGTASLIVSAVLPGPFLINLRNLSYILLGLAAANAILWATLHIR